MSSRSPAIALDMRTVSCTLAWKSGRSQADRGEHFTDNTATRALAAAGFAVMCAGIVVLTQTAPATMAADIPDGQEGGQHGTASGPARPTASGFSG